MSYCHLTLQEREVIQAMRREGASLGEIGHTLGRNKGTISRELNRNSDHHFYGPHTAQHIAEQRRKNAKVPWKMKHARLRRWVLKRLQRKWSPEVIAAVLRRDYSEDTKMQLSPSAIYDWIDRDHQRGGKLWRLLPLQQGRNNRRRRRPRRKVAESGRIVGRVGIEQRPKAVDKRSRYGDWEGDTIRSVRKNKGHSASLLTQVERKSRYLLVLPLANRTTDTTASALRQLFRHVPRALRKTLTLDNGSEFGSCPQLAEKLGLDIYYTDPYAAWQRGANEQVNGLLRRFFPKQTDFAQVSRAEAQHAAHLLNHLPRKCLQYQTPHEVFWKAVADAQQ